jgi:hypothetical protein
MRYQYEAFKFGALQTSIFGYMVPRVEKRGAQYNHEQKFTTVVEFSVPLF